MAKDKVIKYKKMVASIIDQFEYPKNPNKKIEILLIKDMERGHFLVFLDGWESHQSRTYGFSVHLQVTDTGKIWIREDTTDPPIAQALLDKGVPKSDIILGYYAPTTRKDMGFAVA
ncbi:MAG: element excision factor XisI family protein [Bacteroidota bacterium]